MKRVFEDKLLMNYKLKYNLQPDEILLLICILIYENNKEDFNWNNQKIGKLVLGFDETDKYLIDKTSLVLSKLEEKKIIKLENKVRVNIKGLKEQERIIKITR